MAGIKTARAAPRPRMPKTGVHYPKGKDKTSLIARIRKAFGKTKVRQLEANH